MKRKPKISGRGPSNSGDVPSQHRAQMSRLVSGVLTRLYTQEELRQRWLEFWENPTETGVGKRSLQSIIHEELGVTETGFESASPDDKAGWCIQISHHPEMASLYGYMFRQLHPNESAKADALLMDTKPLDFLGFSNATMMNTKDALFYLAAAGFGWLLVGHKGHQSLFFQALQANGITETRRN